MNRSQTSGERSSNVPKVGNIVAIVFENICLLLTNSLKVETHLNEPKRFTTRK